MNYSEVENGDVRARLWHGDALQFLQSLPSNSVDLVLSSPPYCVGKEYDLYRSVPEFKAEIQRISGEIIRVLKDGGNLCWQVGHHVANGIICPLDAVIYSLYENETTLKLRNRIVWCFGHGAHAKKRFSGRHETILWYSKGDGLTFELDAVRVPQKYPGKRHYKGSKKGQLSGNPLGKNPGDVWEIPNVKAGHVEKTDHPCQFPMALAKRLVAALSPKGGTVVDPYTGSGTTGATSLMLGRNFGGADLNEAYLEIAKTRLLEASLGTLQLREDVPVSAPNPRAAVSQRPAHFAEWQGRDEHLDRAG